MNVNKYNSEEIIKIAEKWYKSPEGKASTAKAWKTAQESSRQLKKQTQITPELLNMWIGI